MNRGFRPNELAPKVARVAARVLVVLVRNATTRNRLRAKAFQLRPHLPVELLVEPGDVVVQVGTPHPRTIERLARAATARGHVTVLEPEQNNYRILADHAAGLVSRGLRLHVLELAAGATRGTSVLRVSTGMAGDHTLAADDIRMDNDERGEAIEWQEQTIEVVPLDELELVGTPDVIVVTTNGSEPEVLAGASSLLNEMGAGARIFSKAHARTAEGETVADLIEPTLRASGFETARTRKSRSVSAAADWEFREGDVFGFK